MKILLLTILCAVAARATPLQAAKDDDLSEPVDGVRGRLVIGYDPSLAGAEMAVVYLELQNVSDVGNPKDLWFNEDLFKWRLVDETGAPAPEPHGLVASIMSLRPYWIVLPHDSTLRFRVSVSGYGIMPNGGIAFQLPGRFWQVPRRKAGSYHLSATFTVSHVRENDRQVWNGTLILPKIQVPEKP